MKIGVPGEFHEDRWQRTAEDSERRVLPRTREAGVHIGYKLSRGEAFFWPVFGTTPWPTGAPEASHRSEGVIYRLFGTATPPTGTPGASRRGEGAFWPVFGTATPPTGTSVPSSRGEPVIY